MWSLQRTVAALALVPWLTVSSALPPEHIHEADVAHHHDAVAHRHFSDHDDDSAIHDHDAAEVEPEEGRIVWIDDVGIAEAPRVLSRFLVIVPAQVAVVLGRITGGTIAADEATLPHGPPGRLSSPRAPPSSFQLT